MEKKITQLIILFVFLCSSRLFSQAAPEILHYNFNGTSTLIPNMASSPPLGTTNATIVGTQTLGGIGQCGSALVGDGSTSSYVNTGWTTSLSGSWSISFWTASITPSSTLWYIFGDPTATSFRCFTNGVAGANNWMLRGPITDIILTGGATMAPQLNTFVYNSTTGVISSYLNAVFNSSVTQSAVSISGTGPFSVGLYSTNNGLPSGGLMDEFRFYSRALTLTEIQGLLSLTPTATAITTSTCGPYVSAGNNTYTASGNFTETVISCGGNVTNTLNLTINTVPSVTVAASSTLICDGKTTSLTAGGTATSYSWSSGATTFSSVVAPSTTTNYIVTGSLASCAVSKTIAINVNPSPFITLSASAPSVCLGNSMTLTASGAPIYSWTPVTSSNTVLVIYPTTNTTYSVTGTNTYGCSNSKTVDVIVNSFTPGISSPTTICAGQEAILSASGGSGYNWSTNWPFSSLTVTPAITTVYSVTANGPNTCPGSNSTTVTVNPNPTITATAQRTVMCKGEKNTITASGAASYSVNNVTATSPYSFTATIAIPVSYTVTGVNALGCSDTRVLAFSVNACTGLAETTFDRSDISIYPNPNTGLMTLEFNSNVQNTILKIYNALGNLVKEQALIQGANSINIQDQARGIYFIHIEQDHRSIQVSRIVKN